MLETEGLVWVLSTGRIKNMGKVYGVNTTCLRYIVPFKFSGTFDETMSRVEAQREDMPNENGEYQKLWERRKSTLDGPESDLYDYVRNEFRFENDIDSLAEQKTGCEWLFWKSKESEGKNSQSIKELLYYPEKIQKKDTVLPKPWNINITNLGLMLLKNGLGMIWYEIKIPENGVDSKQLKKFQNIIRELNRDETAYIWEQQTTNVKPAVGIVLEEKSNEYMSYINPFSFGKWINSIVGFLDVTYLAERKNLYEIMVRKTMENVCGLSNKKIYPDASYDTSAANLPDKAILFSYVSLESKNVEDEVKDRYTLTFHITNGYNDSYHFSEEIENEIKRPFDNVFWYATQEGVAYISWPECDNKAVFNNIIPSKVRTDYFALYLKVLYQSFSLLIYAERIQEEISAVNEKNLNTPLNKRGNELFGEINLFLTKSMATSVSHIHHQSEFYVYLKRQLRIHDDVKSVTAGLNALDSLQREQRQQEENQRFKEVQEERNMRENRERKSDNKIQAIMGLFAMLGISSALVDCFDFIGKFDSKNGDFIQMLCTTRKWEIAFFIIIGIISIIAIFVSVKAIIDAFRNKD